MKGVQKLPSACQCTVTPRDRTFGQHDGIRLLLGKLAAIVLEDEGSACVPALVATRSLENNKQEKGFIRCA